ncbi:MAG: hypothetical protein HY856_10740 [Burkholderiales bacterium]|jgi:hypothetical protein|nr:hypothetical protein [Burkholderiales bacterium]
MKSTDAQIIDMAYKFASGDTSAEIVSVISIRLSEALSDMDSDPTSDRSRAIRSAVQILLGVGHRAHLLDRLQRRDQALIEAMSAMKKAGLGITWVDLARYWARFVGCQWLRWQDDASPPADATELSRALFLATRWNNGKALGARSLQKLRAAKSACLEVSSRRVHSDL